MPGPKPQIIELSETVRQELEQLATRHKTGQQKAQRARIILKAAEGKNHAEIAHELKISVDMATLWRRRWLELEPLTLEDLSVEERLEDLPRPGAPPRITADQLCQIEQMACEAPEKTGRPISQWTNREIADEIMARGIVESISPRHAGRLLKKGGSGPT
jgi:putative transposase